MLTRSQVLSKIKKNPAKLSFLPPEWMDDREVVLTALRLQGLVLGDLSPASQDDEEYALEAYKSNWESLRFVSKRLTSDFGFMSKIVELTEKDSQEASILLNSASGDLRNNDAYIMACLEQNPLNIEYAPKETYRNNYDLMLSLVKRDGTCYYYASEGIKRDRVFMKTALAQTGVVYSTLPPEFRDEEELIVLAAKTYLPILTFDVPTRYKDHPELQSLLDDKEFVRHQITYYDPEVYSIISERLRDDEEFLIELLGHPEVCIGLIRYASERLKKNREIAIKACRSYHFSINDLTQYHEDDLEVMMSALSKGGRDPLVRTRRILYAYYTKPVQDFMDIHPQQMFSLDLMKAPRDSFAFNRI
jgi:hypothetical protein